METDIPIREKLEDYTGGLICQRREYRCLGIEIIF